MGLRECNVLIINAFYLSERSGCQRSSRYASLRESKSSSYCYSCRGRRITSTTVRARHSQRFLLLASNTSDQSANFDNSPPSQWRSEHLVLHMNVFFVVIHIGINTFTNFRPILLSFHHDHERLLLITVTLSKSSWTSRSEPLFIYAMSSVQNAWHSAVMHP